MNRVLHRVIAGSVSVYGAGSDDVAGQYAVLRLDGMCAAFHILLTLEHIGGFAAVDTDDDVAGIQLRHGFTGK